ncbi:Ferredoxin subunit of nitrite reductase or a ring-hydroxylating dioxygenase [Actinokineospora alba]|uniref:Cytochrome bc1 complex Rieske iron-sulfur subunit n=1 Tax=Actinokineospora alba TaxID=504798 RepID=A0A1H0VTF2_9PSEU|nr:Rieske (2Fe-2S) protein [Actinokineospora alba]TDP70121.1 nitrite reductase/ring-hydroxylating ferredoxin subunit [Actinokineospora alba]SDI38614.1 Ferredoxin subunit of nitrite reductase or a ring-hydroxylating dioxygenase [Actinokineospora alba]SDP81376.1 Ferredoxin subunit of nitrite reductase or a ring-hydroxylating dioxygenase [Actinokineospora alba]
MTAVEPTTKPEARSRREVLCGLMVALVAPGALVAACSDTTAPAPSGGGTGTSGGAAPSGPLAALADVPKGGGLVLQSTPKGPLVLVRPTPDTVKAFNASCPHQGTVVSAPAGGTITCPNHGSTFDGATGALKGGPATTGLKEVPVKVEGDQVVFA